MNRRGGYKGEAGNRKRVNIVKIRWKKLTKYNEILLNKIRHKRYYMSKILFFNMLFPLKIKDYVVYNRDN